MRCLLQYGFRDDTTFYTEHGDVFAMACAILGLVAAGWSGRKILSASLRRKVQSSQVLRAKMSVNDLEFAYAPVRDQVRDLREYL